MKLTVVKADHDDIFTDTVRIPMQYRGEIQNGTVVRIGHNDKCAFAIARGLPGRENDGVVAMDEFVRSKLGLRAGGEIDQSNIRAATAWENLIWYWRATNPVVHASARLAVISLVLGVVSVALGVLSLCLAL